MEFDDDFEKPVYVGDIASPTGLEKMKVDGIALVTQLDGTGSEPLASGQRDFLIEEIKTHQVEDITGLLSSKDNSMALITGLIPPGAKKGDRFDVIVQCVKRSKTSSLEGGFVMQTRMKPFVQTRSKISFGHNSATARGRVVIDSFFESGDQKVKLVSGMIPGGGVVTRDRECGIRIIDSQRSIKNAALISQTVNSRFSARVQGRPEGVANPLNDRVIEMLIPEDYRHNVGRYFHVVLNIVFNETPTQRVNRMERLERDLHNPEKSKIAAIRLEAIGEDARNILKRGLRSKDFEVQFQSAQALAYMTDNSGADILEKAADIEPAFRWHALTALASIKDSTSEAALADLFNSDSAEARYGAFRALRDSMPESYIVDGEFVGREFMMHTVVSTARPMVHLSRTKVPEVVFFGGDQQFNERLLFFQSGLTVKWQGPNKVLVQRYLPGGEEKKITCSTSIPDVIRQMARLGSDYGDIIRLLKDARQTKAMDSQLVINAVPQLSNSYHPRTAALNSSGERSDKYVTETMPEMFDDTKSVPAGQGSPQKKKGIFRKFW